MLNNEQLTRRESLDLLGLADDDSVLSDDVGLGGRW